jgi:hypothetical protein
LAINLPWVDDRDPVAKLFGFLEIMGGQHHRHPVAVQLPDIVPQLLAKFDIDPRRRFVEHQDWRRMNHRLRHQQPPFHSPRQRSRIGIGLVGQPHRGEQFVGDPVALGHIVQPCLQLQRLARGEEGVEQNLLRDDPDRRLALPWAASMSKPQTSPAAGLHDQPARMLIKVDLPAPLGPSRPKICPRGTSKLTSSSARLPPA